MSSLVRPTSSPTSASVGWQQLPRDPTLKATTPMTTSQISPLEQDHLLAQVLLHRPYFHLMTLNRVCKQWKSVLEGEDFDNKLFRIREGKTEIKEKIEDKTEFRLHPVFGKIFFLPDRDTVFNVPFGRYKSGPDQNLAKMPFLAQSVVWPPIKNLQIIEYSSGDWDILDEISNEGGVTLRQAVDTWEYRMKYRDFWYEGELVSMACDGFQLVDLPENEGVALGLAAWVAVD